MNLSDSYMADAMDGYFKFNIGELVCHKSLAVAYVTDAEVNDKAVPHARLTLVYPLVILERWLQQCHGGLQRLYSVRLVDGRGVESISKLFEFELEPYSDIRLAMENIRGSK